MTTHPDALADLETADAPEGTAAALDGMREFKLFDLKAKTPTELKEDELKKVFGGINPQPLPPGRYMKI